MDCHEIWYRHPSPSQDECNNFVDPLIFDLALQSGQNDNLFNTLIYDQIPDVPISLRCALCYCAISEHQYMVDIILPNC